MSKIKEIRTREIKDSRGNPTVEVELKTEKGVFVASCPSGKSTGKNEAVAIEAKKAIENVNKVIAKKLKNLDVKNQKELDELMVDIDGTENKSKLGANAILPVSIAICRAGATANKLPLYEYINSISDLRFRISNSSFPLPSFNILEGGEHVHPVKSSSSEVSNEVGQFNRANDLDIQEFMVVPQKKSFSENFISANKIYNNLKEILIKNYGEKLATGDEGGFAPPLSKTEQALFLLKSAIGNEDLKIIIDAAASQFYKDGKYLLEGKESTRSDLVDFYKDLVKRFPIIAIEDPFAEDDWQGWKEISNIKYQISKIIIVGDDLTTTNTKKIKEAKAKNACNGIVIKPNQVGTVTEAIEAVKLAKSYGWKIMVSHRSGETMDSFISDLAVGIGADFIKAGSPSQPERMVKYNRLLEIEEELK